MDQAVHFFSGDSAPKLITNRYSVKLLVKNMKLGNEPYSSDQISLGHRVKFVRKYLGMSQSEFAKSLEVGVTAISNWERGFNRIGLVHIRFLLEHHQISADFVISGYVNHLDEKMLQAWRKFQKNNGL